MSDTTTPIGTVGSAWWTRGVARVKARDPELLVIKRSIRAAVVMPTVFALTHLVSTNPQVGLFGAFGSFALLLLVDFPGRPGTRLCSYLTLFLVGTVFITVGTVVSEHKVLAVIAMAIVGFAVLFVGIVSPQAVTASTAVLLMFVLPVAVAEPVEGIGPRLVGWVFAGAICIPACMLVWPTPWHDTLRRRLASTISAVGRSAAKQAEGRSDPEALAAVASEVSSLRHDFAATPYPPTGATAGAVAMAKLVGRVEWVVGSAELATGGDRASPNTPRVRAVMDAVADTMRTSATLICDDTGHPVDDPAAIAGVQRSVERLEGAVAEVLEAEVATLIDPGAGGSGTAGDGGDQPSEIDPGMGIASSLDPSFHARSMGIAASMVADAALESAGGQPVLDRTLGPLDEDPSPGIWRRLAAYLSMRSVWFRNAVRGAVGLALAVAIVEVTDVEHGFWVVLGTLSVLRSNALGTGSTALRAVGGTAVGVVLGSAIMIGVGGHTVLLWVLLPVAVLVSGIAPAMISFAAGQAGFSVVVIILFNIIEPTGWRVGLTRVEDVAIGCAVSLVVGLLFWPRGATAALGRALSDAFALNSGYLADAVDRLTTTSRTIDVRPAQREAHRAYLRLDDAFRQFLAERGAKVVPVETVSNLFTGANRIRLAAYTLATLDVLPPDPGQPELESVSIAGAVLRDSYASSHHWYGEFAELLADDRDALDPPPVHDDTLHVVLRAAFDDARARKRGDRLRATLRMLWADQLLENQRQVQVDLARSADRFVRRRHQGLMV